MKCLLNEMKSSNGSQPYLLNEMRICCSSLVLALLRLPPSWNMRTHVTWWWRRRGKRRWVGYFGNDTMNLHPLGNDLNRIVKGIGINCLPVIKYLYPFVFWIVWFLVLGIFQPCVPLWLNISVQILPPVSWWYQNSIQFEWNLFYFFFV